MRKLNLMIKWLDDKLSKNSDFEFSHQHILLVTRTNCPYSILRALKSRYSWDEKFTTDLREYTLDGKKFKENIRYKVYYNVRKIKNGKIQSV